MANSNDEKIFALKKQIEEKRNSLKQTERFSPVTNCSIEIDGVRYNINVMTKEQIIFLLVKLNIYKNSATELGFLNEFIISGFSVSEWIADLTAKLMNLNRKNEQSKLKMMEDKLTQMLSEESKIELELNEIENLLK